MGDARYNNSLLLVETGSYLVQSQSSTVGHWQAAKSNPSLRPVDTRGAAQYNQSSSGGHWEKPSTTISGVQWVYRVPGLTWGPCPA